MKLQFSGLGWSAAKCPLFWSCPLFLDLFMYYFLKMVTEKSPVKWSYPLFLESAKLESDCSSSIWVVPTLLFYTYRCIIVMDIRNNALHTSSKPVHGKLIYRAYTYNQPSEKIFRTRVATKTGMIDRLFSCILKYCRVHVDFGSVSYQWYRRTFSVVLVLQ